MTDVHVALRNLLLADTNVTSIVSTRIYPMRMPIGNPFPVLTIHRISNPIDHLTNTASPRFQISVWTQDYAQAQQLRDAVINCLNRYKGVQNGINIKQIVYLEAVEIFEEETSTYHIPTDFRVIHI
ncbi:MAG: DUF3168 domain-containing protein [Methanolobus sp.]|uniref:DUF3168 domain-containing protein n=1 Tax=Methanolobus sp. TaxID=1874737 RepID=UPI00272F9F92|nr:DUF3168 domain-containing protein [Methanolobus sp.]MDP2217402.1 DUF3168 domain-containing protein [Methanolobus sp.]